MNRHLPNWSSVAVVVAHPDDESFGLGAIIDAFVCNGAQVAVLCLTQGEASTLGAGQADLAQVRAAELRAAGAHLGVSRTTLKSWPDAGLSQVSDPALLDDVIAELADLRPDGVLVFEPSGVTGHPDHAAATALALKVAGSRGIPVLAWTLTESVAAQVNAEFGTSLHGTPADLIDIDLPVSRARQRLAIAAHASQAVPGSILWRRLELMGDREALIWLPQGLFEDTVAPQ